MKDCSKCQSKDIIKYGFNHVRGEQIQKYKCCSCGAIFSYSDRLPSIQVSDEIVCVCMDMYFEGVSYRTIQRHLKAHYKIHVSHVTIYYWIQKYSELIKRYVDSFKPKLSAVWQIDETYLTAKGAKTINGRKYPHGFWLWVCIDTGTRYVLDMHLSLDRSQQECDIFFENIKKAAGGQLPEIIASDGQDA